MAGVAEFMSQEPLTVSVKKTATLIDGDGETVYRVNSSPRGFALIINNVRFSDEESEIRKGAGHDGPYMKQLFQQLNYDVKYSENLDADELDGSIDHFKKRIIHGLRTRPIDSIVVVVMSHGSKDEIVMSDDVSANFWDRIVYKFDNKNLPALKGIPKIFITQACENSVVPASPEMTDIIVCFAVIPGHLKDRDTYLGSWFIYCLTKVFMENAFNTDLEEMLKKVQKEVLTKIKNEENPSQVSTWQPFLFKKFYFNPAA